MANLRKLKIAYVLDDGLDAPNGVQQYVLDIGSWMKKQGHEVHYIVGETKRTDIDNLHVMSRNIKVKFNGNVGSMPLPAPRQNIKQLLQQEKFDILHIQMPYSPFMAHKVIKLAPRSTAVIGTFHIAPNSKVVAVANRVLGICLRSSLKRFKKFLSVSEAANIFAKQTFKIDSDISPNVVDYELFNSAKKLDSYRPDEVKILFLGRLVPRKGCQILLEAINDIKDKTNTKIKVIICGKGPLMKSLQNYVETNGLESIVNFEGFISEDEKPKYYKSADIAVFPSSGGESFGIVLIEAMASGGPAILAGDNPGYHSVLKDKPELLFRPSDVSELSTKLLKIIDDKSYRDKLKTWGNNYVKKFDINNVGNDLLVIYDSLLQNS